MLNEHFIDVLSCVNNVKHTLCIGTADIKDTYIESKGEKKPFLKLIGFATASLHPNQSA